MRVTLRYRLLASFLLVMFITLVTATLPLLVMLRELPAPREESLELLRESIDEYGYFTRADQRSFPPDVLELLNLVDHEFEFMMNYLGDMDRLFKGTIFRGVPDIQNGENPQVKMRLSARLPNPISLERLARGVERLGYRLLLTEARKNHSQPVVLYDSEDDFQFGEILDDFHLDSPITSVDFSLNERYTSNFGDFRDHDGEQWVFYGMNWFWQPEHEDDEFELSEGVNLLLAEERPDQWQALREPLLRSLAISSLVAVALAFFISRSIGKPLLAFARAAEAVAEGDLEQRVPVSGPPEMRHAARAFNHMSVQVRETQRVQRELLANISHDLRTPLTSIQGFSQAIIEGATRNVREAARVIHVEAGRLNRLVSGLLDLSRVGEGIPTENLREVDLRSILQRVCQQQQIQAEEGGIALQCDEGQPVILPVESDLVEQAVINLVSNALQFTPSGGRVIVRGEIQGNQARVIVEDNGPGIPSEQRERIFERFYQLDSARGPRRGAGLGLSIVREIARAHGGRVWAEAAAGGGARFVLELPLV